jgi:hypothetical protein
MIIIGSNNNYITTKNKSVILLQNNSPIYPFSTKTISSAVSCSDTRQITFINSSPGVIYSDKTTFNTCTDSCGDTSYKFGDKIQSNSFRSAIN